jgi:tRNA U38,U39,U40 pseudouridine synthase TruA
LTPRVFCSSRSSDAWPNLRREIGVPTKDTFNNEDDKAMTSIAWAKEFPGDITICDAAGVILDMNDCAAESFTKDGGRRLVGSNLLDCHSETSRSKLQQLLAAGKVNAYTIEKGDVKKLIYQTPWYEDGKHRGLVEVALVLPDVLPHFVRDGS